jgi:hypothetical protein
METISTKDKNLRELKINFASLIIQIFTTLDTLDIQHDHNRIFCREYGT